MRHKAVEFPSPHRGEGARRAGEGAGQPSIAEAIKTHSPFGIVPTGEWASHRDGRGDE